MATLITVLGMHRSGTSATVGTLEQHGVALGPVAEGSRFNPRGNRELRRLNRLHNRILRRSGGSWWRPPAEVVVEQQDRERRDSILALIEGETIAVKDPRMLVALELWRELDPLQIGVIRNPVAVCDSLERRAAEQGKPLLERAEWEALWRRYNERLVAEIERRPFPVVDFDRPDDLEAQVRAALAFHGIEAGPGAGSFVDPGLLRADEGWRERVLDEATLGLWERLAALARSG